MLQYTELTFDNLNLAHIIYSSDSNGDFLEFTNQNGDVIFKSNAIHTKPIYTLLDANNNKIGSVDYENGVIDFTECGGESFRYIQQDRVCIGLSNNCLNTSEITSVAFNDDKT